MAENFPNLVREMDLQVTEANRSPNFINARRPTPRHIVVKLAKVNDKEKILRTARQKKLTYKGTPDRKSTRLNSSHANISYAVFCLKKKKQNVNSIALTQTKIIIYTSNN